MVMSSVTFAPVPEDHNTILKCLGDNPELQGFSLEDSFKLDVVCKSMHVNYYLFILFFLLQTIYWMKCEEEMNIHCTCADIDFSI